MVDPLDPIFRPRSVAVIGASRTKGKFGYTLMKNLITNEYQGKLFPVNSAADSVWGVKAYPSVLDIPDEVDLGIISVPADAALQVAEECGKKGVRGLIVIAAGFREVGPAGEEREKRLKEIARKYGMKLVGPNCMGIINTNPEVQLDATFAPTTALRGEISFLSQSGALGVAILEHARNLRLGFAKFVSLGNKADVSGNDLDEERDELVMRASFGLSQAHAATAPVQKQHSLAGQAMLRGEPVTARDLRSDALYRNKEFAQQEGLLSFLAVPFKVRDKAIGTFNCYMGTTHAFSAREIELFSTLANQTALAIENANLAMNALLVREMHHRVKNNLQMIAMLLRLQLRSGAQVSATQVLHQTINRILSIAAVHEALSQEGFRLIGVKGLIQQAAHTALQTMVHPGQNISLTVEGADFRLPSQPATSLAIAANELIQNALEHGFRAGATGSVQVLLIEEDERFGVQVRDDGIGLPKDFTVKDSLGLQIVEALITEDLHGTFELAPNPASGGTVAMIRVPKSAGGLNGGGMDAGDRSR